MVKVLMKVIGMDGQIDLLTDRVIIYRTGFLNMFKYGLNSNKEIPLSAITTVNFRPASKLRFGQIEFSYGGRKEKSSDDDTKVKFAFKAHDQFYALKERIFQMIEQRNSTRT